MRTVLLILLCAAGLTGCAGSWPANMPATTYSGVVRDSATGKRVGDAGITASREPHTPGIIFGLGLVPMDEFPEPIGETRSDRNGRFTLTTKTGYAEWIDARTPDGAATGRIEGNLKQSRNDLVIELRSHLIK